MSHHDHHILSTSTALKIFGLLIVLTGVTVGVAQVDLGQFNLIVAILVATVKALLVTLIFMNLLHDKKTNSLIFGTSFFFVLIFIGLTSFDWYFRGDVMVKGDIFASSASAPSKFKKPWIATPELIAYGKESFAQQCVSCHGAAGKGDGAAAAALNPHPRNFTAGDGWKNGRKPSQIFKTLKEGIPGGAMASYAGLPQDQRWAISHFVATLGPKPWPTDSAADLAAVGVDPNKDGAEEKVKPSIPIKLAMARLSEGKATIRSASVALNRVEGGSGVGASLYRSSCVSCHGADGRGGFKIRNLGGESALVAGPLNNVSAERFNQVVVQGLPGLMPAHAHFSGAQLRELQSYVKGL